MKCPVCGSLNFFVKDPDDEYETFEFELKDATIVFIVSDGGWKYLSTGAWTDDLDEVVDKAHDLIVF